jgi:hypothetical protein
MFAPTIMKRETMKAPQKEHTMIITLPIGEKGTRSPKPIVQIVMMMTHTDWKN